MMHQSKAQSLLSLREKLTEFRIPEIEVFSVRQWSASSERVLAQLFDRFGSCRLAIRSSAHDEDGSEKTKAGEYHSALNVPSADADAMRSAIETVIASYQRNGARSNLDEVIVQVMLENTVMSGVVFTHDLNTGAPYYVINYDDDSGLTNTVTSGESEYSNRTLYIHRGATQELRSERFQRLMRAVKELEVVTASQFLDIEFAIGADLTPCLLQVRAITTQPNWNRAVAKRIDAALDGIQSFLRTRLRPMAGVHGATTVLGQMPDWNPAEMIGRAPRALAFSLYKALITDHAWRNARETMGYAVPDGQPLMVSLAGQPFIDSRLSFHSYLPVGLPTGIATRLVDSWVAKLRAHPDLHDKVEFEVAITTYSFDMDLKMARLAETLTGADRSIFKDALHRLTVSLIGQDHPGSAASALARVDELAAKQAQWPRMPSPDLGALFTLVEDCIRLGTTPFAILARHGFIAKTLLLSLHSRGILSMEDVLGIQSGIRTVASDLVRDMRRLQLEELSRRDFMARYGHLRPGTYDIRSLRYDQMPDLGARGPKVRTSPEAFEFFLTAKQTQDIARVLDEEGFPGLDAGKLLDYVRIATAGREYGKFVFTRSVSDMLELIAEFGERHGLSRDEMSHVSLTDLLQVATASDEGSIEDRLRDISMAAAERHVLSTAIRLPQVLFDEAGVHVVPFQVSHPNFITSKKITADCIVLNSEEPSSALTGKIVLIEKADPGYDCIFSEQIAGLITKYGGANSHMAIRCAEFGIPAAIGCGEQRFESLAKAHQIMLDCSASFIQPVH